MFLNIFGKKTDGSVLNEYLATTTACFTFFAVGTHIGWTSPFISQLQSDDYPFEITNEAASYITIFGPIGDIFGTICSTQIVDIIGRKYTTLLSGLPILTSCILIYFSYISPVFIYVARFCGGMSMGTAMSIIPMYISEISRPAIRGKLTALSAFCFIAGLIAINMLGSYLDMYQTALVQSAVILVFFVTFSTMPKTPYYLMMNEKPDQAANSLKFLRRAQHVEKELAQIREDVKRQQSERGHYSDLLSINSNRKALFIMVFGRVFQQTTGATSFAMYAQNLLSSSNEVIESHLAVMIVYALQTLTVLICGNLADRLGRVPLMIYSMVACSITLMIQGLYFQLRDLSHFDLPIWLPPVFLGLFYMSFQIGIGTLLNAFVGEIFSTSIKAKATCITNITYSISVIMTTKFFQISTDYLHVSVSFYVFAICSLIGAVYMKIFLPETKGRTLEEIQMDLKGIVRRKSKLSLS